MKRELMQRESPLAGHSVESIVAILSSEESIAQFFGERLRPEKPAMVFQRSKDGLKVMISYTLREIDDSPSSL